jgi:hypothetical protein
MHKVSTACTRPSHAIKRASKGAANKGAANFEAVHGEFIETPTTQTTTMDSSTWCTPRVVSSDKTNTSLCSQPHASLVL